MSHPPGCQREASGSRATAEPSEHLGLGRGGGGGSSVWNILYSIFFVSECITYTLHSRVSGSEEEGSTEESF